MILPLTAHTKVKIIKINWLFILLNWIATLSTVNKKIQFSAVFIADTSNECMLIDEINLWQQLSAIKVIEINAEIIF